MFIILDAARADYARPDTMPFLSGMAHDATRATFDSPPGFAQRTVLFTGRYPDTSGNFSAFVYDPDASPFQWVRRLGPLANLVRPRRVLFPARLGIAAATRRITHTYHADPAWIPPKFLPFFRPCEDMRPVHDPGALGATSIFDLCREQGLLYRYLAHPVSGDDDQIHATLVRELRAGAPYDFYACQFSATDQDGHVHGPFSPAMQQGTLRDLDGKLGSIHAALEAGYDSWDLFLCGDHGMAPVRRRVNVLAALARAHARPARDYVVFVNSTLAVFWFLTARGRREVEPLLHQVPGARPVSQRERAALRIPTEDRWGHAMLAADPGVLFWPDYFHVTDTPILGMHGYLDKVEETGGLAVLARTPDLDGPRDLGERPLVDVFPTLCDILGLPTPPGQEGTSLIARPRRASAHATHATDPAPAVAGG